MPLTHKYLILQALLIVSFSPYPLLADLFSKGQAAIVEERYETAYELFSAAAKKGDAEAEYGMGVLYSEGWGVEKEPAIAFSWFQKAALQDYPPAQYSVGNAYFKGFGVEINIPEAEIWWDIAARNGYSQAQFNLGMLLFNSDGPDEAKEQGIAWTRAAAKQGVEWADKQLAAINEPINYTLIIFDQSREPARSEAHITTLQANLYTIQLTSTTSLNSAIEIIQHDGLEGRAMIYRSTQQEMEFGIIYGTYESIEDAKETIASMKANLQKMEPSIQPIRTIQDKIEAWRIARLSSQ